MVACPITKKRFFFIMRSDAPRDQNKHVRINTEVRPIDAYNFMLKEYGQVSWVEMLSHDEYAHKYDINAVADAKMLVEKEIK